MRACLTLAMIGLMASTGCDRAELPAMPEGASLDPVEERIRRVENGLILIDADGDIKGVAPESLTERMAHYGVAGVGIAVIDDFEIHWSRGYGVLETGRAEDITLGSLFHAGSVFKPVIATAALMLVQRDELDLDEDLNRVLLSWKIPKNEYTAEEKVTLRRLLSHSGGLTDGFTDRSAGDPEPEYLGSAGVAPVVTIQEMLDAEPGVDVDGPTHVTAIPGTKYRYANADFAILMLLLEDVTGRPLADFMSESVLEPLGMSSSTFEMPLPESLRSRATTEHYANGQPFPGKRHHFPIGSLWTTPSDLARFAIEIMRAHGGKSDTILSQEMAGEMLSPQIATPDGLLGDSLGLAFQLRVEGRALQVVHTGATWGSTCVLWFYPEIGQGAVIMTNSASSQGIIRFEILLAIASEYGWPIFL